MCHEQIDCDEDEGTHLLSRRKDATIENLQDGPGDVFESDEMDR